MSDLLNVEQNKILTTETSTLTRIVFLRTLINIFSTIAISFLVIISRRVDYIFLGNNVGEASVIEITQLLMLIITTVSFYRLISVASLKSASILVFGFFTVLIIRESDGFFDQISHGFWVYPALIVTFISVTSAVYNGRVMNSLTQLLRIPSMQVLVCSTVLLIVFSRLYGMSDFWKIVMGDFYIRDVKNISEETIELLFYCLIAFNAFKTYSSLKFKHTIYKPEF
ncbi:MAG: hypothetical protein JKY55_19170 [Aliivibrio sp.]|uniref:hypothetical protein n=1 Tax=Aliivibrio sp. TaxID=1872443 RepID=UPI001A40172E|nr:hypothetical protein [Aliivibrio sp.]